MHQTALARLERGDRARRVQLGEAVAIARVLGLDLADLLRAEHTAVHHLDLSMTDLIGQVNAAFDLNTRLRATLETLMEAKEEAMALARTKKDSRERTLAREWLKIWNLVQSLSTSIERVIMPKRENA